MHFALFPPFFDHISTPYILNDFAVYRPYKQSGWFIPITYYLVFLSFHGFLIMWSMIEAKICIIINYSKADKTLLFSQVLKFNLTESGLFCVLPWLTMAVFANIGGWIADTLVSKGLSITAVRKASINTVAYSYCFVGRSAAEY